MAISRRKFLNRSALSVAGGVALSAAATNAFADVTLIPLPPIQTPPAAAAPTAAAPVEPAPAPAPPAPVAAPATSTPEASAFAAAAIASVGYEIAENETAEVRFQFQGYPAAVKDFRAFHLSNSDGPTLNLTPNLRLEANKSVLGIKI